MYFIIGEVTGEIYARTETQEEIAFEWECLSTDEPCKQVYQLC